MSVYKDSGVDIDAGDAFSAFAGEVCRASSNNSPFVEILDFSRGHFRGPKGWRFKNLRDDCFFDGAPDGIGTKTILIDAANSHDRAPEDLFAMTGTDLVRWGGKSLIFFNILDVEKLGEVDSASYQAYRRMMLGLGEVARQQQVVVYKGETAELNVCMGSENPDATTKFNWAGCMIGALLPDRVITGETLETGQAVVALQETGPRSNGISAIRRGLREQYGDAWYKAPEAHENIVRAARRSTLYDLFLSEMNGWTHPIQEPIVKMHLIAHISGGGIVDKFAKDLLFKYGFSAVLDRLYSLPTITRKVIEWTGMEEWEAYRTFSCGQGALVVIDTKDVEKFVSLASKYRLSARDCGRIMRSDSPSLQIQSPNSAQVLEYHPEDD